MNKYLNLPVIPINREMTQPSYLRVMVPNATLKEHSYWKQ